MLTRLRQSDCLEFLYNDAFKVLPRGVEAAKRIIAFWSQEKVPPHLEDAPAKDIIQGMFGATEVRDG